MDIDYAPDAEWFNETEFQMSQFYVYQGEQYTDKNGRVYTAIETSKPGDLDVVSLFSDGNIRGRVSIPKILFFMEQLQ